MVRKVRVDVWSLMLVCLPGPLASDESARLALKVRDSVTGVSLAARLLSRTRGSDAVMLRSEDTSVSDVQVLRAGPHELRLEASGYRPLETRVELAPGTTLPITVWLDPVVEPRAEP